ncbi:cold shock domain-containing protein [Streptomyces sp. NRRL S-1448]|uniref:cold shock domain-containing protein n=1 Tax=Streptomyces sp. NRRL S-1448 TaxID=1463883 RepID=UPI00055E7ADC
MTAQDGVVGGMSTDHKMLQEQADRLVHLKAQRGNPSYRTIEARAKKLFGETGSLPIATQSAAFGAKSFVSSDKLMLLVRTLLSWNEYGEECEPPSHRDAVLDEWRTRWSAIAAQRQRRPRAAALAAPETVVGRAEEARDAVTQAPAVGQTRAEQTAAPATGEPGSRPDHLSTLEILSLLFAAYPNNQIFRCTVTSIAHGEAYVRLTEGVTGSVTLGQLDGFPKPVQTGDELFAMIDQVILMEGVEPHLELSVVEADLVLGDDPRKAKFDPSRYGMPARYDKDGKYIYPEGFDAKTDDWLPGFEEQRDEWNRRFSEAEDLFRAHQRHLLERRADAPNPSEGKRGDQTAGVVKRFNPEKGYGFISVDVGPDFFVHYSKIEMEGFRVLEEGQHVHFIPAQGTRGPEAHHVRLIDS